MSYPRMSPALMLNQPSYGPLHRKPIDGITVPRQNARRLSRRASRPQRISYGLFRPRASARMGSSLMGSWVDEIRTFGGHIIQPGGMIGITDAFYAAGLERSSVFPSVDPGPLVYPLDARIR